MRRLACFAAAALIAASTAGAEESWRFGAFRDLMSPYCPGRTLDACPSPQAAELRQWITAQEEAGRSREEVEEELVRVYGDGVLSAPRPEGWGLTAYAFPLLAIALGGTLLFVFLRRVGRAAAPAAAPIAPRPAAVDSELARRVDEEIGAA
jgi:cytochrome c-type biogenesis protein CcmH